MREMLIVILNKREGSIPVVREAVMKIKAISYQLLAVSCQLQAKYSFTI